MAEKKDYTKNKPIGQFDETSCWAACLSWWLKATNNPGYKSQSELISMFQVWANESGTIPLAALTGKIFPTFGINMDLISAENLSLFEPAEPLIICYNYPEVNSGHMNVIVERVINSSQGVQIGFFVMEPYYPLSAKNGQRSGAFVSRPISHFTKSSVLMGWRR